LKIVDGGKDIRSTELSFIQLQDRKKSKEQIEKVLEMRMIDMFWMSNILNGRIGLWKKIGNRRILR
jgi:hypothetical protein